MADPLKIVTIAASANILKRGWGSKAEGLRYIFNVFSLSYPTSQKRVEFTYDDRGIRGAREIYKRAVKGDR